METPEAAAAATKLSSRMGSDGPQTSGRLHAALTSSGGRRQHGRRHWQGGAWNALGRTAARKELRAFTSTDSTDSEFLVHAGKLRLQRLSQSDRA